MSKECTDRRSQIFIQYSCIIEAKEMNEKWVSLSIVAGCVTVIGLIIIGFTILMENQLEVNYSKEDLNTITVNDYAVSVNFHDNNMFNKFYNYPENRKNIEKKHEGSAVAAFREYLIKELPIKMALDKNN